MTINDFENNISQTILERGYSYFSNEHIISLNEDEPGMWYAVVSGNENYNVTIEIKKNSIKSWECDCPFEGTLCKHVAAVLYAIKEINLDDSERVKDGKSKKKKSDEVKAVLSRISKDELFEFLNLQFRKDRNLRSEFLAHFSDYIEASEDGEQYRNIVKNLIAAAGGRQEFIEYRSVHRLCSSLMKFVNKAEDLLDNGSISEAIKLCKILKLHLFLINFNKHL